MCELSVNFLKTLGDLEKLELLLSELSSNSLFHLEEAAKLPNKDS